jgi:hypothetical protein
VRIDERIEAAVRDAYAAVMAKDAGRLASVFRGLADDDAGMAIACGVFVCGFAVNDVVEDARPADEQLRELATRIIASESDWVPLGSAADLARLLEAAARGDTAFLGVPGADLVSTVFVAGGYLLNRFHLGDQNWWDYFDDIWFQLEAAPEPT